MILSISQAIKTHNTIRPNESIIMVGGCFDILHAGHIDFLNAAKQLNGAVTVLLESDETVKRLKGNDRPVNTLPDRAKILNHLQMVDIVIPLPPLTSNDDYSKLVFDLKPDIIAVTENDSLLSVKQRQAQTVNGRLVIVTPRITGYSTQGIISKIKSI